jgi:hypothetical protein
MHEREEWQPLLHAFTQRNAGRRTHLEIDGPDIGAQQEEHGYLLRGATFDPRDGRVSIMLGPQADVDHHLTRSVEAPDSVEVLTDDRGQDRALLVRHGPNQTLLRLM